jgi:hypothetical protein
MATDYFECPQCKVLQERDYKKGEQVHCKKCKVAMRKINLGSNDDDADSRAKEKRSNHKARKKGRSNGNR